MKIKNLLSLILFMLSLNTFASPKEVFRDYLQTMSAYKKGELQSLDKVQQYFWVDHLPEAIKLQMAKEKALTLIQVLDRIERVDVNKIPKTTKKNIWIYKKRDVLENGKLTPVEISLEKKQNEWRFSKNTVDTISIYYQSIKNAPLVKGVVELNDWKSKIKKYAPAWMGNKNFILMNGQWVGLFILIFIGLIVERFGRFYLASFVFKMLKRYELHALDEKKEKRLTFPFGMMTLSGFISLSVHVLELEANALSLILKGANIIFTVATVGLAHHLVDVVSLYFEKLARDSDNKFDDILVPLIKKTGKFFVISVGIIAIGDSLSLDMKGILTGLGIGGLAFALAAKDTLSNLFGSLTVLLDRPFRIGDWVTIGDIEGIVEEVGLRSTRIRTFYDSLITVPNGTLTNVHVDNYGQRRARRLNTTIGVQYDTDPKKLQEFCEKIRELILNHPLTKKEGFHVYFNSMGDFSLNILLYVFFVVPTWQDELKAKHELLSSILKLGNDMGVEFAFPTQTIHLANEHKGTFPKEALT